MKLGLVLEGGGMRGLYTGRRARRPDGTAAVAGLCHRRLRRRGQRYFLRVRPEGPGLPGGYGLSARPAVHQPAQLCQNPLGVRHGFRLRRHSRQIRSLQLPRFSRLPHGICHRRHRRGHRPPRLFRQAAAHGRPVPPAARLGRHPLFSPMVEFRGRLYLDGGTRRPPSR